MCGYLIRSSAQLLALCHPLIPSDYCGFVYGLAILRLYRFLALSL